MALPRELGPLRSHSNGGNLCAGQWAGHQHPSRWHTVTVLSAPHATPLSKTSKGCHVLLSSKYPEKVNYLWSYDDSFICNQSIVQVQLAHVVEIRKTEAEFSAPKILVLLYPGVFGRWNFIKKKIYTNKRPKNSSAQKRKKNLRQKRSNPKKTSHVAHHINIDMNEPYYNCDGP